MRSLSILLHNKLRPGAVINTNKRIDLHSTQCLVCECRHVNRFHDVYDNDITETNELPVL